MAADRLRKIVHFSSVLKVHKLKIVRGETNLGKSYCERRKSLNFFLNTLIELLFFISGGVSFQNLTAAYFATKVSLILVNQSVLSDCEY